eukprot:4200964-Ditylum_brightwellii.AAC.1
MYTAPLHLRAIRKTTRNAKTDLQDWASCSTSQMKLRLCMNISFIKFCLKPARIQALNKATDTQGNFVTNKTPRTKTHQIRPRL